MDSINQKEDRYERVRQVTNKLNFENNKYRERLILII